MWEAIIYGHPSVKIITLYWKNMYKGQTDAINLMQYINIHTCILLKDFKIQTCERMTKMQFVYYWNIICSAL